MDDEGAGYIRISDPRKQRDNHSPDVQRAAIQDAAQREGYVITVWDSDEEKGRHTTKRPGYQRVLDACRNKQVKAIFVFSTSRWGRRVTETAVRAEELDHLDIPMYSVTQAGWLRPGITRLIHFGLDEEYSRMLATNVRPARRQGAQQGIHQGPTPYGYQRLYQPWTGHGSRPPGELVIDEETAWVVRELFDRYAAGNVSCRSLAQWLNADPRVPRRRNGHAWTDDGVRSLLTNVTYTGQVGYDQRPQGHYERARKGEGFVAPGRHAAIVDLSVWEHVQRQLHQRQAQGVRARADVHLGAGLFVCAGCGSPMGPHLAPTVKGHHGSYLCSGRRRGGTDCAEPGYRLDLAHTALLAELRRLRGRPWTPQAQERLQGDSTRRTAVGTLRRALATAEAAYQTAISTLARIPDPDAYDLAAFARHRGEIRGKIDALKAQIVAAADTPDELPELRAIHAELCKRSIGQALDLLDVEHHADNRLQARKLLIKTVASARVVERRPAKRSTWLRLEVTWTEGVQTLLEAGLLTIS